MQDLIPAAAPEVQADLKTIAMLGAYGASVITAVTAQNTTGVQGVYEVLPEGVAAQLDSVCQGYFGFLR